MAKRKADLDASQERLEANLASFGKRLEQLSAQLAERRRFDAAIGALLTRSKRPAKAKGKTGR